LDIKRCGVILNDILHTLKVLPAVESPLASVVSN